MPSAFGHEHGLRAAPAVAELVRLGRAGLGVDLDDRAVDVDLFGTLDLGRVPVAVLLEPDLRVVPRELLGPVVEACLGDPLGHRVDHPPVERRQVVAERTEPVVDHDRVVAADVDDDRAVGGVVGVERVEDVARVDVAPDHVVGRAVAGEQADAAGAVGVPLEREARSRRRARRSSTVTGRS